MKYKLIFILCLLFTTICNAQTSDPASSQNKSKKEIFTEVDEMPDFPEGTPELIKYLKQNTKILAGRDIDSHQLISNF